MLWVSILEYLCLTLLKQILSLPAWELSAWTEVTPWCCLELVITSCHPPLLLGAIDIHILFIGLDNQYSCICCILSLYSFLQYWIVMDQLKGLPVLVVTLHEQYLINLMLHTSSTFKLWTSHLLQCLAQCSISPESHQWHHTRPYVSNLYPWKSITKNLQILASLMWVCVYWWMWLCVHLQQCW